MQTGRSNCDEYLMRGRNISLFNLHQHKDSSEQSNSANSTECPSLAGSVVLGFKRLTIQDQLQTNTEMRHLYFILRRISFYFFFQWAYAVAPSD